MEYQFHLLFLLVEYWIIWNQSTRKQVFPDVMLNKIENRAIKTSHRDSVERFESTPSRWSSMIELNYHLYCLFRLVEKPRVLEKPWIWQFRQETWNWAYFVKKTWNFEQKSLKHLKYCTKGTKKPGILNNFYILCSKTLIWHEKYII